MTDTRNWRLGTHYRIHGYAETPGSFDDEPIFTAMNSVIAEQIIKDHQGSLADRLEVQVLVKQLKQADAEILYLSQRLQETNQRVATLTGNALRTVGIARRANNVLGELLDERGAQSTTNAEAACE
jgi:hypothetical protein